MGEFIRWLAFWFVVVASALATVGIIVGEVGEWLASRNRPGSSESSEGRNV